MVPLVLNGIAAFRAATRTMDPACELVPLSRKVNGFTLAHELGIGFAPRISQPAIRIHRSFL